MTPHEMVIKAMCYVATAICSSVGVILLITFLICLIKHPNPVITAQRRHTGWVLFAIGIAFLGFAGFAFALSLRLVKNVQYTYSYKQPPENAVLYGTTDEACTYEIDEDGLIAVTSGTCPVTPDGKHLMSMGADGCRHIIMRDSNIAVPGTCRGTGITQIPEKGSQITTDLIHGHDGCDYALARDGETSKVPGSCP